MDINVIILIIVSTLQILVYISTVMYLKADNAMNLKSMHIWGVVFCVCCIVIDVLLWILEPLLGILYTSVLILWPVILICWSYIKNKIRCRRGI